MQVVVCGPNLTDQSKGDFHVHKANCGDVKHYGYGKRFGGEDPWEVDADSTTDVVTTVYDPSDFNYDPNDADDLATHAASFWLAPCCRDLDGAR